MHWSFPGNFIIPGIGFLIWLAVVIYLLTLAHRLVGAVERIAEKLG